MRKELTISYTLYTSSTCSVCPLAKKTMERAGADFTVVNLSEDEAAMARVKEAGLLQVPVVEKSTGEWLRNIGEIRGEFIK